MESLTGALAVELAPIRVNIVVPGVVRTDLWDSMPDGERQAMYTALTDSLPVGRVGEAEDVAQAIVFLMGNGYTTGTAIPVNGGALLT
jgi:NAD(P)-dependent dehydrogenase (short-subunit alcohol dehydrogenase family)